jgi:hypothetical protein
MANLPVTPAGDHKRDAEVPNADWDDGMNPATNAPAIGFNDFTLGVLDEQTQSLGLAAEDLLEWPTA